MILNSALWCNWSTELNLRMTQERWYHKMWMQVVTATVASFGSGSGRTSHIRNNRMKTWNCFLYAFFWVIPWCLNFICRRFGTLCLFHLHRKVSTSLWRWNRQSVPKRQHIRMRRQEITQKKAYSFQNMAKIWNQEWNWFLFVTVSLQNNAVDALWRLVLARVVTCSVCQLRQIFL